MDNSNSDNRAASAVTTDSASSAPVARRSVLGRLSVLVSGVVVGASLARASQAAANNDASRIETLEKQLKEMSNRLGVVEDIQAIRKVQHAYGYYMDKCLYEQVVDLFADDGEVVFGNGVFKGKAGVRRLYLEMFRKNFTGGKEGPVTGFLLDHPQLQDIVDVSPDRSVAHGRFRVLMQAGSHESRKDAPPGLPQQWWEGGIYENTYRRDNGIWKIQRLNYHVAFQGHFEDGWRHWQAGSELTVKTFPENPSGPDEMLANGLKSWPETPVVPYHYANPVTGKRWTPG